MALTLGPLRVDPPVVLAPMAGVTSVPFRTLCRTYGAGLYVSEMISARALVERNARTAEMLRFGEGETVRSVQLHGVDPAVMGQAVRMLVDEHGVHHVDINMGCPVAKVTRAGGGAAIPVRRRLFRDLVTSAVRAAGDVPVTVKLRVGVDARTHTYLESGRAAAEAGVAGVALHARTAEQLYGGRADWTAIARLKEALPSTPVVGNGDVWSAADAKRMLAETGCDGVMVGRGCLGQPWLFRDLADAFAGRPVRPAPRLGEVSAVMRTHVRMLVESRGDEQWGVHDFRKHVGWYLGGYPAGREARRALTSAASLEEFDRGLEIFDPEAELLSAEERVGRGHTTGPRPVTLPHGWRECPDDPTPPRGADVLVSGG